MLERMLESVPGLRLTAGDALAGGFFVERVDAVKVDQDDAAT